MGIGDDQIERLIAQLKASNETALARLNQHLQAMLPVYVDEGGTCTAIAASTVAPPYIISPYSDNLFKVTGLWVSVPLNCTSATLQLGSFIIPLQNTTTLLSPIQKILSSTDRRVLNFTTGAANGGSATVLLWGETIPAYGKL